MNSGISLCDVVEVLTDDHHFRDYNGKLTRWRVTGYLKTAIRPKAPNLLAEFLFHSSRGLGPDNQRLQWCTKEDAEYVALYSGCGSIARVTDCRKVGRVSWSGFLVADQEASSIRRVGELAA